MKIRYRTMTLLVSILASVALVGDRVRRRTGGRRCRRAGDIRRADCDADGDRPGPSHVRRSQSGRIGRRRATGGGGDRDAS